MWVQLLMIKRQVLRIHHASGWRNRGRALRVETASLDWMQRPSLLDAKIII